MHQDFALDCRAGDYDRFLAIQVAPAEARGALYAVTAFSAELARIAETVSEPLIGHMRLAWWREALEEIIAGGVPRPHPLVQTLAELYSQRPFLFAPLLQMIEARGMDLDESLMAEEEGWQRYLDGTAGALHMAWAQILNPDTPPSETIRRGAIAYAMIGLVRAIPYMQTQGFLRFPAARIQTYGVASLAPSAALNSFVQALVEEAEAILKPATSQPSLRPLYALRCLALLHGGSIRKAKFNVYEMKKSKLAAVLRIIQFKLFLC